MTDRLTCWMIGLLMSVLVAVAQSPDYADYNRLLSTYVSEDGVDYDAWHMSQPDHKALDQFLKSMAQLDVSKLHKDTSVAFYINLYNAAMIQAVLDNYPLKSVKDIGLIPFRVFKQKFIRQGDRTLSLDDVEKGILLKDYFDPRIHFAVNCASESCPPLRAEAFVGARLDQQLDEQTHVFAESSRAAQVNEKKKRIAYSELFNWYAKDFGVENPAQYLNRYRDGKLKVSYKVEWIPYDWSLNATKLN